MAENNAVLIGTSALSCGLDIDGVTRVIHYGLTGSMSQLVQESGRAGRRGQNSQAILLSCHEYIVGWTSHVLNLRNDEFTEEVISFTRWNGCRREFVYNIVDGTGFTCRQYGSTSTNLCDNCGAVESESQSFFDLTARRLPDTAGDIARIREVAESNQKKYSHKLRRVHELLGFLQRINGPEF